MTVICNSAYSHTFDLSMLIPDKTKGLPHPMSDPRMYGKNIYAALFPPGTPASQALAARPSRILLVLDDDELDAFPWEYAYGPTDYLVCLYPFVRGLAVEQRREPPKMPSGLHIIAVVSSPLSHDLPPLNIPGEWTRLTEIVGDLDRAVKLQWAWPPTIQRLRELVA